MFFSACPLHSFLPPLFNIHITTKVSYSTQPWWARQPHCLIPRHLAQRYQLLCLCQLPHHSLWASPLVSWSTLHRQLSVPSVSISVFGTKWILNNYVINKYMNQWTKNIHFKTFQGMSTLRRYKSTMNPDTRGPQNLCATYLSQLLGGPHSPISELLQLLSETWRQAQNPGGNG